MTPNRHILEAARRLVEAPSPSGREGPALAVAEELFREAGLETRRLPVPPAPGTAGERYDLLGFHGRPRAVLLTHVDTVPGGPPAALDGDVLRGRGACDAKGILAAMVDAAREAARRDWPVGVAAVVGEETTSDGALVLDRALADGGVDWPLGRVLIGEPTENRWVKAHPGVLILEARAHGREAHSSQPEEGVSAVHRLVEFLARLRSMSWPSDPELGPTRVNVGRIEGGRAANVIAAEARAEIMFRGPGDPEELEARLRELASEGTGEGLDLEVTCLSPPVRFALPPGEEAGADVVAFSTDAPFLRHAGDRYLLGPGSIRRAHTDEEQVTGAELAHARDLYLEWLRPPESEPPAGGPS